MSDNQPMVLILVCDAQGLIQLVNAAGCMVLGYSQAELMGRQMTDLVAPETSAGLLTWLQQAASRPAVPEKQLTFLTRAGLGRDYRCAASAAGSQILIEAHDLSLPDPIQQQLKQREYEFTQLIELSPFPLMVINSKDQQAMIRYQSQAFRQHFGTSPPELPELTTWARQAIEDRGGLAAPVPTAELWVTGCDGQQHLCELSCSRFQDQILVSLYDVTERNEMEEALKASEARTRQYLDALPIGVSIMGLDHRLQYVNRRARELQGRGIDPNASPEELAEVYQAYIRGTDQPYPLERMPLIRALQGESASVDDMEIRQPERRVPIEVQGTPVYDDEGELSSAIVAFSDISERLR
ncbi:MAG: PAS domain S-box protein, partial [Candidatus Sericytochromatia bacterium]